MAGPSQETVSLQDAHIHLQDSRDAQAVLSAARLIPVSRFFCNATRCEDWQNVIALAAADERIVPFIGVHPWMSALQPPDWDKRLEDLCAARSECGIGEVGLDAVRKGLDFSRQVEVCNRQIGVAVRHRRPFVLHCVAAWRTMLDILRDNDLTRTAFMVHAFSGSLETLKELAAMGAYISFRTLENLSPEKESVVRQVPEDRLLLESDFPYLAGKRAQDVIAQDYSGHLEQLYARAAHIRAVSGEDLQVKVWNNGTVFTHAITHR